MALFTKRLFSLVKFRFGLLNFTNKHGASIFATKETCFSTFNYKLNKKEHEYEIGLDNKFYEKYIMVKTCVGMWADCPQGVYLDTGYIDSHADVPSVSPNVPVVMFLHGAPGCHTDFLPVMRPLVKLGFRVIAPSFPGFGYTRGLTGYDEYIYTNDINQQVDFIKDFIKAIGVDRVDLMVGHGTGSHPALIVSAYSDIANSLALICPVPHKVCKGYQQTKLMKYLVDNWDYRKLRLLIKPYLYVLKHSWGWSQYTVTQVIAFLQTITGLQFNEYQGHLLAFGTKTIPVCIVYSGNDEKVETEIMDEFADILGIQKSALYVIDKDSDIKQTGATKGYPKGLFLESGTHDPLEDYYGPIVRLIWNFVNFNRKNL